MSLYKGSSLFIAKVSEVASAKLNKMRSLGGSSSVKNIIKVSYS